MARREGYALHQKVERMTKFAKVRMAPLLPDGGGKPKLGKVG